MKLIHQDDEVFVDEYGEAGGPDYNLGKDFSRSATFSTPDGDYPYRTITITAYVTGMIHDENHSEPIESGRDLDELHAEIDAHNDENPHNLMEINYYEHVVIEFVDHSFEDPSKYVTYDDHVFDYEYEEIGYVFQDSLEDSEKVCMNYIKSIDFERDFA